MIIKKIKTEYPLKVVNPMVCFTCFTVAVEWRQ